MATPPRSQYYNVAQDSAGNAVTSTRITVYVAPPYAASQYTTLATLSSAETGAGTVANPFLATTGEINFWVPSGSYDIKIEDTGAPAKYATKYVRFDADPGDKGTIAAQIADNSLDASVKLIDGSIPLSKLATAVQNLLVPVGVMVPWAGRGTGSPPTGWLFADGSTASTTTYPLLDALIGAAASPQHVYNGGASPGSGLFKLPDKRGRGSVGADNFGTAAGAAGVMTSAVRGARIGADSVALVLSQIPAHNHGVNDPGHGHSLSDPGHNHIQNVVGNPSAGSGNVSPNFTPNTLNNLSGGQLFSGSTLTAASSVGANANAAGTGITIQNNGSGSAHSNISPVETDIWIIKAT